MMFSQASKIYERSKCIRPLTTKERMKIYASKSVKVEKKVGCKKFSPFNTVSRQSRNSFLLRVTKQPNTKTNYQVNPQTILQKNRRATIDKAQFQRIIGDVKNQSYNIDLSTISNPKCLKSYTPSPQQKRPLTVRDHQKWRQTFQSFDFNKQQQTNRLSVVPKLSFEQTTNASFMKSLKQTIQSNFNNFQRFKYFNNPDNAQKNKTHSFESDFGHEYLKQLQRSQKLPQYDILKSNEGFIKTTMNKPKGSLKFDQFKQKILTRFDRLDPEWHTKLAYSVNQQKNLKDLGAEKKLSFDNQTNRQPNDVFSKYPIRLSMESINKIKPIEIN